MFSVSNTSSQTSFQNTVESLIYEYELIGNKEVLITEYTVLSTNLTAKTRLKLIISCTKNYKYKKLILVFVFLYFSLTPVLMIYLIMLVVIGFIVLYRAYPFQLDIK